MCTYQWVVNNGQVLSIPSVLAINHVTRYCEGVLQDMRLCMLLNSSDHIPLLHKSLAICILFNYWAYMHICVYMQIGNLEDYYHFELPVSGSQNETAARRSINPTSGTGLRPEITQAIKTEENVCHYLANLRDQNSPVCLHITQFKPNTTSL